MCGRPGSREKHQHSYFGFNTTKNQFHGRMERQHYVVFRALCAGPLSNAKTPEVRQESRQRHRQSPEAATIGNQTIGGCHRVLLKQYSFCRRECACQKLPVKRCEFFVGRKSCIGCQYTEIPQHFICVPMSLKSHKFWSGLLESITTMICPARSLCP